MIASVVALVLLAAGAMRAVGCPREVGAASCCAGPEATPDDTQRIERACCCIEPADVAIHRPADLTGLRPSSSDEGLAGLAVPASRPPPWLPDQLHTLPFKHLVTLPPPTLFQSRTAFLC